MLLGNERRKVQVSSGDFFRNESNLDVIFRFSFDSIPAQLRFIFALYKNLDGERDPDVELFILQVCYDGPLHNCWSRIEFESFGLDLKHIPITLFQLKF